MSKKTKVFEYKFIACDAEKATARRIEVKVCIRDVSDLYIEVYKNKSIITQTCINHTFKEINNRLTKILQPHLFKRDINVIQQYLLNC